MYLFVELFLLLISYLIYTYLLYTYISYIWFWCLVIYGFVACLQNSDKTHPLANPDEPRSEQKLEVECDNNVPVFVHSKITDPLLEFKESLGHTHKSDAKMGTFQRNAIISGYINSYCLVCERFFETEDQTFSHIKEDDHENTLLAYPYLEKYGNNGIRKVKAGYFCEYCSQLMATGAKVNLHIAEKLHYYNKGYMLLKQSGSAVTAFDDVLITENAWHTFHEDECWLCNTEFDDQTEHMSERSHIVKLLQNQVQFGNNNSVYRKIDRNDFQCLTCNTKLPLSELEDHFGGDDNNHNQRYLECQEEKKKHDLANPTPKAKEKTEKSEDVKRSVSQDNVNNKETIAGIAESTTEANKKASNTNNTEEKPAKAIDKKDKVKKELIAPKFIVKEETSDPVIYAKENQLIYDAKYQNTYCRICQNKFPSSIRAMKEHVKGKDHINKLVKVTPKPSSIPPKHMKLFRNPSEDFIQHVRTFNNILDNDIVLNEKFCVPEKSCQFFTKIHNRFGGYRCQICLMDVFEKDIGDHCKTVKHEKGMRETPVITNPKVKVEFIREVRPETFHCGFCNLVMPGWAATEAHIKTTDHKSRAASCNRRLQLHLPAIRAQQNDDKIKAALFDMVVNRMRD